MLVDAMYNLWMINFSGLALPSVLDILVDGRITTLPELIYARAVALAARARIGRPPRPSP